MTWIRFLKTQKTVRASNKRIIGSTRTILANGTEYNSHGLDIPLITFGLFATCIIGKGNFT
jgi:hypothetical protein